MRASQGDRQLSLAAAVAALPLLAGLCPADGPANMAGAIFTAARAAVDAGRVESSKPLGFHNKRGLFNELPADGAVLVGFDVGIGKFLDIETVYALRAVYMTANGETSGQEHGLFYGQRKVGKRTYKSKVLRRVRVLARPGYAVGGVTLRSGLNINGLSLTFMRINGRSLDPRQSYTSEWVGDRTGGNEAYMGGDGAPVVGIHGSQDVEHVSSLGLVYMNQPPVVAQAPPPLRTERPAPPRVEVPPPAPAAPVAPPKEEHAQAPPAAPREEKQAEGPAAPNPERDEDRPWPAPKAPPRRVAKSEPATPAEPPPPPEAPEGVDWLPFVGFAAVLVPGFCLVLFMSLGRKKSAPAPERRPAKVDLSRAAPVAPAASPSNLTAICDRPRPAGEGARRTPPCGERSETRRESRPAQRPGRGTSRRDAVRQA
jgi:hypothetical protein